MPFDLASLEYAPFRRLMELATPFELVKLKRFGLQHSLTEKIPNVNPLEYFVISFAPQKILLRLDDDGSMTLSPESRPVFLTSPYSVEINPNVEKVDTILINRVIMQPERIRLPEFTFNKHSFIFSHPCRRFVTTLTLIVPNNYTFVGGEFSLIAAAFPALEELTVDYNHALLDWIDSLVESPLKKSSKLLVTVDGWTLPSMEDYESQFVELFKDASPGFKLKFTSEKRTVRRIVSVLYRLGFSVHAGPFWYEERINVPIKIYKIQNQLISIHDCPNFDLDNYKTFKLCQKRRYSDFFDDAIPEILCSCSMVRISKMEYKSKLDQRFLNQRFRFEATKLYIRDCELDNDIVIFTKPFAHQVKKLVLMDVRMPNANFIAQLFKTFPAVEKLGVWQLPANGIGMLLCNDLSQLKRITVSRSCVSLLPKYIEFKAEMVKELFKRTHSSFHLHIDSMEYTFEKDLPHVDKIRTFGFEVIILDKKLNFMKCKIYCGIQEYIRLKSTAKEITIGFYDDRIVLRLLSRNVEITADTPKIQLMADRVIFEATWKSFKVDPEVRNNLVIQPTVVKLLNCVNEDFFELAEQFAHSVKHLDLRECVCKKTHFKKQKKRIRQVFPNLIKLWDI